MSGSLPLSGLLVADFSRILAGPLLTQTLAEMGSTVVKVEHPDGGDDTRSWGPPFVGETTTYFASVNQGKWSIALDLKDAQDLDVARSLVAQADVLVENFRPGVMDRLGLGYRAVAEINPRLVYCSITGFGSTGEGAGLPGFDLLVQAMAGWMHVTGQPDGPPTKVGMAVADVVAGLQAAVGVLAALSERHTTGRGRHVTVSLFEAALAGLINLASGHLLAGDEPMRDGNRHPSIAPYEPVMASDRPFVLAAANDRLYGRACRVLGRPDLAEDARFVTNSARRRNADALIGELESVLRERTAAEWIGAFRAAGVPAGPINTVGEAFELADRLGLDLVGEDGAGGRAVRSPIVLGDDGRRPVRPPPELDGDGDLIRSGLASDVPLVEWLEGRAADRPG
jgi:crotonobetainyl-CoA:carnitine CoA-transferase CaiB-like acyl-CoA transferase